jgi:hypothetical protein
MTTRGLMIAVFAAALLSAAIRYESSCTPVSPVLALLYLCCGLGADAARRRGKRWQSGFWLGLILGPIGVILAASNPIPEAHRGDDRNPVGDRGDEGDAPGAVG